MIELQGVTVSGNWVSGEDVCSNVQDSPNPVKAYMMLETPYLWTSPASSWWSSSASGWAVLSSTPLKANIVAVKW